MKNIARPGMVLPRNDGKWDFGIIVGNKSLQSALSFESAAQAKEAMRDYCADINSIIDERIDEAITVTGGHSDHWPPC